MTEARTGEGWAASSIDELGDGPGIPQDPPAIGVTAFGMNAIVLPPGSRPAATSTSARRRSTSCTAAGSRWSSATAGAVALEPGGVVRVDAATVRMLRNTGDEDAVYVVVGGADGYVGRDGRLPEGETERVAPDVA